MGHEQDSARVNRMYGLILMILLVPSMHGAAEAPARVTQPGTASHGREIYSTVGCADCHAATLSDEAREAQEGRTADGGRIRAGHPLEGAPWRGSWWNGRIATDAGEASDFCLRSFIDPNSEGFTAEERKALVLFMQELGSERGVSPLVLLRRDAGDVDLRAGVPARGRVIYQRVCVPCHAGGAEAGRALIKELSPAQIAEVIRKGSGRMVFFQVDRLTSPQVADVAAYLDSVRKSR